MGDTCGTSDAKRCPERTGELLVAPKFGIQTNIVVVAKQFAAGGLVVYAIQGEY